jgi:hypothetical protein
MYNGEGARAPLTIVRDADLAFDLVVTSGGAPLNMSGASIVGELYDADGNLVVTFTATVSGAGLNIITMSLTRAQTLALAPGGYSWTLWVTRGAVRTPWLASRQVAVTDGTAGQTGSSGTYTVTVDGDIVIAVDVAVVGSLALIPNTQIGNYTLAISDADGIVEMNAATLTTVTVPPNSSVPFPIGTMIGVYRMGVGAVSVAGAGGVVVRNAGSLFAQFSEASLRKRATDEWVLVGDLT